MTETKLVTWRHLKPGQSIEGWKEGARKTFASATVKEANPAFVKLLVFGKEEKQLNSEATMFEVPLTEEEMKAKYGATAEKIRQNIMNRISEEAAGTHEMWNSWLSHNSFEVAATCEKEKFMVIGHCELSVPKYPPFGELMLDIGICCEYEDGERFWCHASRDYLKHISGEGDVDG